MTHQAIEKRQNPRVYVEAPMTITPSTKDKPALFVWIQDISLTGIRVKTEPMSRISDIPEEGEEVELKSHEDYFRLYGSGEIVWLSLSSKTMGIKFTRLGEESKETVEELLRLFPAFCSDIRHSGS